MRFDRSNYQHQFREYVGEERSLAGHDHHVFQTISLNDQQKRLWTIDQIEEDKVIGGKWGHQQKPPVFGGSWTVVNMHEVACASGITVAYRLSATYDFDAFAEFAEDVFSKYLLLAHSGRCKRKSQ
ncbi:hypothetical protein BGW36DRAFT_433653 [Talaromyces proteolyticus]|uniref:Uncharacterized protein n=1 Tax=Talaromyces proteolyticus TaxID=1131652 RepID=A0AAD4KGA0_9EURO|nr:uncharacterized protein BGW36DRAFT_433653 [Talaromyces proteolyticus]KAH8689651.1 hypothetical protein BGW36DRAFT_433653 [Talaromyces proteolyticus]